MSPLAGKRHALLNGRSDRDSGMSDTNSDIETIMSSAPHSQQDSRMTPELTRSNSDVAALLSRRGKELKDKTSRSRSIDPTKIQVDCSTFILKNLWDCMVVLLNSMFSFEWSLTRVSSTQCKNHLV